MLSHAGLEYCGDIIAETVSRVKIPQRIVIGDAELSDLELLASTLTEWRTDVEMNWLWINYEQVIQKVIFRPVFKMTSTCAE